MQKNLYRRKIARKQKHKYYCSHGFELLDRNRKARRSNPFRPYPGKRAVLKKINEPFIAFDPKILWDDWDDPEVDRFYIEKYGPPTV